MEIIEISKKQVLKLLLNSNPFEQGQFGIITLIGDKLYKFHYKDFIKTYIDRDESKLDYEADIILEVEKTSEWKFKSPDVRLQMYSRLLETKSNDLITGILSYRGLFVGIEMNYYKGFITLLKASKIVNKEVLDKYINNVYDLVNDLMFHNIVPSDIKEDNILVNIKTSEVKLIDLDGNETVYGPPNYIYDFPYQRRNIDNRLNGMVKRLKKNN